MKKTISKLLLTSSLMFFAASSQATQVTGTVSYFYTNGNNVGMIVDGLFYYSNALPPAVISVIDVARQTQNGVVTIDSSSGREILGAY